MKANKTSRAQWACGWTSRLLKLIVTGAAALSLQGAMADDFLPQADAFKASERVVRLEGSAAVVEVTFAVADGYYLYRDRLGVETSNPDTVVTRVITPAGHKKFDDSVGRTVETLRGRVLMQAHVQAAGGQAHLKIMSQGCADAGLCYPPLSREVTLSVAEIVDAASSDLPQDEAGRWRARLVSGSLTLTLLGFFGLGILLAFTPCLLPMMPILSAIIIADDEPANASRWHGVSLALSYVAGMAIVYTLLGIGAGLTGNSLVIALQTPWVMGLFAALLALFGAAMLGLFPLQLPARAHDWLTARSQRLPGGKIGPVAVMGGLSALLIGPCVAPPLAGALLFLSQTGNWRIGGAALFCMAWGMGLPLIVLAATAGRLVPKSGVWMEKIKHVLGWTLLALALWTVGPLLDAWLLMLAWGVFLAVSGIAAGALEPLQLQDGFPQKIFKGLAFLVWAAGCLELLGLAAGNRDVLSPLQGLHAGPSERGLSSETASAASSRTTSETAVLAPSTPFRRVSANELPGLLQQPGRVVMLDFYADWCVSCKEMDQLTFADRRVRDRLADALWLQVDVTRNTSADQALLKQYALFGPPATLFFDGQGQEIRHKRVIGFQSAEHFLAGLHDLPTGLPVSSAAEITNGSPTGISLVPPAMSRLPAAQNK